VTVAHVAVNVRDWESARRFYDPVLALLGYRVVYEEEGALAYYADAHGLDFGIGRREPVGGAHVAFDCEDRAMVDSFYAAALAAGARTTARRGSVRSTTPATTRRTSSIPTATTSSRSATAHTDALGGLESHERRRALDRVSTAEHR
jgi:catechol 2,3-dioxygenase-like lactoylglutathione lyase family enzyme